MNGLTQKFSDKIDFVNLNVDWPEVKPYLTLFSFTDRTQYVLADAKGNILQRWYGPLNQADIEDYLTQFLAGA